MMRVADTSFLYAFFVVDDDVHQAAVEEMAIAEPIVVPSEILVELDHLLRNRFDAAQTSRVFKELAQFDHIRFGEPVNFEAVQKLYADHAGRLSLADCYVVQICRVLGARPITFDKRLAKAV